MAEFLLRTLFIVCYEGQDELLNSLLLIKCYVEVTSTLTDGTNDPGQPNEGSPRVDIQSAPVVQVGLGIGSLKLER